MKNKFHILLLSVMAFLASSCSPGTRQYVIGVSQCSQDEWREKQNEEMRREASILQNVTLEVRSVRDDNRQQIADIEYFIQRGVDLLVVSPNEAHAVTPAVEKAYEAGIPVVVIDRKIESEKYTAFVGADNEQIGRTMGDYVRSLTQRPLRLLEIRGLAGSTPAIERSRGLHSVIDSLPWVQVVAAVDAGWNMESAERIADSVLTIHPDIDLVAAQNDRMAIGARQAALRCGVAERMAFVGVDALTGLGLGVEQVMQGNLKATFIYPTGGEKVVQTAMKILNGEPYDRETNLSSAQIDRTNARVLMLQDRLLSEQTAKVTRLVSKLDTFLQRYNTQQLLLWAVVTILLLLVVVCGFIVNAYRGKVRINHLLRQATRAKLAFFTNVSHDFRTPLTLIADPVAQLLAGGSLDKKQHYLLTTVQRNVTLLLRLINQVLDFRKWENGKLGMRLQEFDLGEGVSEWCEVFESSARHRDIRFVVTAEQCPMIADREKLERVLYNLLSNAFKFTPDGGQVEVTLRRQGERMRLTVSDTGIGMPAQHVAHIFEDFYQVDVHHSGSGIGLALVKAFVEMHHGTVTVQSRESEGTTFSIDMPCRQAGTLDEALQQNVAMEALREGALLEAASAVGTGNREEEADATKPLVLVIDDNSDVRSYLRYLLHDEYRLMEAANGEEGLQVACKQVPDAIVCDVMMPVMDGMECCRRLKQGVETSHIPVMMLTAYAVDEQKIEGYDCGADSYIAKPFSAPLLKSRLKNLIEGRRWLQQRYAEVLTESIRPSDTDARPLPTEEPDTLTDRDRDFLSRFRSLVEQGMANPELNVEVLGSELGMSRVQLYRKLKAITGQSPVELVRQMRLTKAKELLSGSGKTVAEVAYEVGFSSPSYFTKCYKEAFGTTPTAKKN